MKPSAPATVDPVLAMVAVTRTTGWLEFRGSAPLLGFLAALTPDVTGPAATTLSVIVAKAPQLPKASLLWTETEASSNGWSDRGVEAGDRSGDIDGHRRTCPIRSNGSDEVFSGHDVRSAGRSVVAGGMQRHRHRTVARVRGQGWRAGDRARLVEVQDRRAERAPNARRVLPAHVDGVVAGCQRQQLPCRKGGVDCNRRRTIRSGHCGGSAHGAIDVVLSGRDGR